MTSCSSTASTSKTVENSRSKSVDTVCSNSSCFFKRRKPILPYNLKPTAPKTTGSIVRQRVLSAKLQKVRSLQSQLNDANFHLAELFRENQALKTLQKRQDRALSKYENSNADLPRLLHQHEEEIRNLTEKNKTIRKNLKESNSMLKLREEELSRVKEQLQHLENLNKDKRLIEKEKLVDQVEDLQFRLTKSEEQMTQLNKKLLLETKNWKHRLNVEISKNKQSQKEIVQAMTEIDRLTRLLETRETSPVKKNRFSRMPNRQSMSLVCLDNNSSLEKSSLTELKAPVSEVKLEPIATKIKEENEKPSFMLNMPSENIKSRLSSGSGKSVEKKKSQENLTNEEQLKNVNHISKFSKDVDCFKKFSKDTYKKLSDDIHDIEGNKEDVKNKHRERYKKLSDEIENIENSKKELKLEQEKDIDEEKNDTGELLLQGRNGEDSTIDNVVEKLTEKNEDSAEKSNVDDEVASIESDTNGDQKLDHLAQRLDLVIQKTVENGREEFDKRLGDYCSTVISDVKKCDNKIRNHKSSIKMYKEDTDKLLDSFNQAKNIEEQIKKSFLGNDKDLDFLNDIFKENTATKSKKSVNDKSIRTLQQKVRVQDKDKLLATLRAIDNGDSVDKHENMQKSTKLMGELFGDVADI